MATLLSAVTADGAGSGASHSGPCTIMVHGDSEFDGATVAIMIADTDTAADYSKLGVVFRGKTEPLAIDVQGSYYLKAVVSDAGSSTSLTVVTTQ